MLSWLFGSSPSSKQQRRKVALVLIDFDQFSRYSVTDVVNLVTGIRAKLVSQKRVAQAAHVRVVAFGNILAFKNQDVLFGLERLGVEVRLVSMKKKEEADRHMEREAYFSCHHNFSSSASLSTSLSAGGKKTPLLYETVVLVSSDQDFAVCVQNLTNSWYHHHGDDGITKKNKDDDDETQVPHVIVVHGAKAGSRHEKVLSQFPHQVWRLDEFDLEKTVGDDSSDKINGNKKDDPKVMRSKL